MEISSVSEKCPHTQDLKFISVLTKIETHTNTHIDTYDTQYLNRLNWAELGGTIMRSCLLDLLSANQSN